MGSRKSFHGVTMLLLTFAIIAFGGGFANAQDSLLINYQGYLTDDAGDPLTGDYAMTFNIYDGGGVSQWSETHPGVAVTDGLFSVVIGSQANLRASVFSGEDRYLGISVDGDEEFLPRTLLTSSPGAAYSKRLVGDVTTGPGMMVLKNLSGDSAVVLNSSAGETGITITAMPGTVNSSFVKLTTTPESASIDIFGPAEQFELAGSLEITQSEDASGLLMSHGPGSDIELYAELTSNSLLIHRPDPCTPPDPCVPAFELVAGAEVNSMKIYPPNPCASPPCTPATLIEAGPQEVDFNISISLPSDDDVTPISLGTSLESQSSHLIIASPTIDGTPRIEMRTDAGSDGSPHLIIKAALNNGSYTVAEGVTFDEQGTLRTGSAWNETTNDSTWTSTASGAGGSRTELHYRQHGGNHSAAVMAVDDSLTQLTLLNGDPAGPPDVVVQATTDGGGQIGINTDTPSEALDVRGTAVIEGFKMATDAADGHVLTSDADGNGTWQPPLPEGARQPAPICMRG